MPSYAEKHAEAQKIYDAAMHAAVQVMELTRIMRKKAMKRIAEPIVRSSNAVCSEFLAGWQKRNDPAVYKEKMNSALASATQTRDQLKGAADSNLMPVEKTRVVVQMYDELIQQLTGMMQES
jgi:four helix bundle protein